jgi:hypothetical protein
VTPRLLTSQLFLETGDGDLFLAVYHWPIIQV